MNVKQLEITPSEAAVLEICLPESIHSVMPNLSLQLGKCMVSQSNYQIGMTERDLWMLKSGVNPLMSVGRATGLDIIVKIYSLLVQYDTERLLFEGKVVKRPPNLHVEEVYANESRNESRTEDQDLSNYYAFS